MSEGVRECVSRSDGERSNNSGKSCIMGVSE